jgi:hypothetical protein
LRDTAEFQRYNGAMLDCCDGAMIMEQYSGLDKDRAVFDAYPAGSSSVHRPGKIQEVIFR